MFARNALATHGGASAALSLFVGTMERDEIARVIQDCVNDLGRLLSEISESLWEAAERIAHLLFSKPRKRPGAMGSHVESDPSLPDLSHLIRLFRSAVGAAQADELISLLNAFTQNTTRIQRFIIVWLDLIEVLVQQAEKRHGAIHGRGKIKTAEVKLAVDYLLRSGRFSMPNVPPAVASFVTDRVVGWAIDMIVLQTNRYGLWETTRVQPSLARRIWDAIQGTILSVGLVLANAAVRMAEWVTRIVHPRPALSPALKAALDAVAREGAIGSEQDLIAEVSRLFIWLGSHREELVQATELVFGAVQEIETLLHLTGAQKKLLAKDVIWDVLEQIGFAPQSGLLEAVVDSGIDLLIEVAVHFFNKGGVFEHRRTLEAAASN
jgi:hypothetical protein